MVNFRPHLTVNNALSDALRRIPEHLYPPRCRLCGDRGNAGLDLCAECRLELPWNEACCPRCALPGAAGDCPCRRRGLPFERAVAPLVYDGQVAQLMGAFKFRGRLADGRLLGQLLARALGERRGGAPHPALVPIPLHRRRLRERGFDQNAELARALRAELGTLPIRRCLARARSDRRQAELPLSQRRLYIQGAFTVTGSGPPRRVALLDDVVTSGATAEEAARALRAAGAERVELWAVARTPRP